MVNSLRSTHTRLPVAGSHNHRARVARAAGPLRAAGLQEVDRTRARLRLRATPHHLRDTRRASRAAAAIQTRESLRRQSHARRIQTCIRESQRQLAAPALLQPSLLVQFHHPEESSPLFSSLPSSCCAHRRVEQRNQILIVDSLLAIGEFSKSAVRRVEIVTADVITEFHVAQRQRMPPGMFAEYERVCGYTDRFGCHDLVTQRIVDDAVLMRSEEHTSELQSQSNLVCRLLLEKKKKKKI